VIPGGAEIRGKQDGCQEWTFEKRASFCSSTGVNRGGETGGGFACPRGVDFFNIEGDTQIRGYFPAEAEYLN